MTSVSNDPCRTMTSTWNPGLDLARRMHTTSRSKGRTNGDELILFKIHTDPNCAQLCMTLRFVLLAVEVHCRSEICEIDIGSWFAILISIHFIRLRQNPNRLWLSYGDILWRPYSSYRWPQESRKRQHVMIVWKPYPPKIVQTAKASPVNLSLQFKIMAGSMCSGVKTIQN